IVLHGYGGQKGRIAEFQLCDLEFGAFDPEFLHVAFTIWIRDYRVLERHLQSARSEQLLHSFTGLIHRSPGFRQCPVEGRKFIADGVAQLRIREPWNVVEVGGDSRRFFHVIGHQDACDLRLEVVTYFGEKPALNEPVGSGLQIIPADLGATNQAGYGDDLGLGEEFFAVGVDFAQWRGGGVLSLRRSRESCRQEEKQESSETRSKMAKHVPIVAETGPATPRCRIWPGCAAGRPRHRALPRCDTRAIEEG